jgi:galactokinase
MEGKKLIEQLKASASSSVFGKLYGDGPALEPARRRYIGLAETLLTDFGETGLNGADTEVRVFTAAGRTELGGNHTDHNYGKVVAASIQLDAVAMVTPRKDKKVLFRSGGFPDVEVDISDLSVRKEEAGTTEALVRGIAAEFVNRGIALGGFTANADSTVLPGSGLSSSAAVEVLFGNIFNHLYAKGQFTPLQIAQFGQRAENNYFGKPSGLMDQAASAIGGAVAMDFKDPDNPQVERIDFDPAALGYALCIVNTKGSHADLTPDYAAIPGEMKALARFFGKNTLRELKLQDILNRIPEIRKEVGDRVLLRSLHYFNENKRSDSLKEALKKLNAGSDIETTFLQYLELVNESGDSSWELLQNVYSPQRPTEQGLSVALSLTREFFKWGNKSGVPIPGACRVHGGGFAGTIQVYIPREHVSDYRIWVERTFGDKALTVLKIRPVGTAELTF